VGDAERLTVTPRILIAYFREFFLSHFILKIVFPDFVSHWASICLLVPSWAMLANSLRVHVLTLKAGISGCSLIVVARQYIYTDGCHW